AVARELPSTENAVQSTVPVRPVMTAVSERQIPDEVTVEYMSVVEIRWSIIQPWRVEVEWRTSCRLRAARSDSGECWIVRPDVHSAGVGVICGYQVALGETLLELQLQAVVVRIVAALQHKQPPEVLLIGLEERRRQPGGDHQRNAIRIGSRRFLEAIGERICHASYIIVGQIRRVVRLEELHCRLVGSVTAVGVDDLLHQGRADTVLSLDEGIEESVRRVVHQVRV